MFRFLKPLVYAVIATVAGSFAYKEGKQALFPAPPPTRPSTPSRWKTRRTSLLL